jgi:hypothetical protein
MQIPVYILDAVSFFASLHTILILLFKMQICFNSYMQNLVQANL